MKGFYDNEGYYRKLIELQDKLRHSEEERMKLEEKFNKMIQNKREEEQLELEGLKRQYYHFLEEDKLRNERNEQILRALDRIEYRAAMLTAKTDRLRLLRKQYENYVKQASIAWKNKSHQTKASLLPVHYTSLPDSQKTQNDSNPFSNKFLGQKFVTMENLPPKIQISTETPKNYSNYSSIAIDQPPYTDNTVKSIIQTHYDPEFHSINQKQNTANLTTNKNESKICSRLAPSSVQENSRALGRHTPGHDLDYPPYSQTHNLTKYDGLFNAENFPPKAKQMENGSINMPYFGREFDNNEMGMTEAGFRTGTAHANHQFRPPERNGLYQEANTQFNEFNRNNEDNYDSSAHLGDTGDNFLHQNPLIRNRYSKFEDEKRLTRNTSSKEINGSDETLNQYPSNFSNIIQREEKGQINLQDTEQEQLTKLSKNIPIRKIEDQSLEKLPATQIETKIDENGVPKNANLKINENYNKTSNALTGVDQNAVQPDKINSTEHDSDQRDNLKGDQLQNKPQQLENNSPPTENQQKSISKRNIKEDGKTESDSKQMYTNSDQENAENKIYSSQGDVDRQKNNGEMSIYSQQENYDGQIYNDQGNPDDQIYNDQIYKEQGNADDQIYTDEININSQIYTDEADNQIDQENVDNQMYTSQANADGQIYTDQVSADYPVYSEQINDSDQVYATQDNGDGQDYTDQENVDGQLYANQGTVDGQLYADQGNIDDQMYTDQRNVDGQIYTDQANVDDQMYTEQANTDDQLYTDQVNVDGQIYADQENVDSQMYPDQGNVDSQMYPDQGNVDEQMYNDQINADNQIYTEQEVSNEQNYTVEENVDSQNYIDQTNVDGQVYNDANYNNNNQYYEQTYDENNQEQGTYNQEGYDTNEYQNQDMTAGAESQYAEYPTEFENPTENEPYNYDSTQYEQGDNPTMDPVNENYEITMPMEKLSTNISNLLESDQDSSQYSEQQSAVVTGKDESDFDFSETK